MPFSQNLRHAFRDAFITPKVTENDFVIFVVGPTGSGKSWFTRELSKNDEIQVEKGQHLRTKNVLAFRCNFKNEPNNIVIVDTPSFHIELEGFNAEGIMTNWIESRFTEKCRGSGILFLHPLARNPTHVDMLMERHLNTFATTFPKEFTAPSLVYVVPTQEPAARLTDQRVNQRLSELGGVVTSLGDNGNGEWFASMFTEVFRGQPDTAGEVVQLLLKGIDSLEFFASPRPALKRMPLKTSDTRLVMKDLADSSLEEFKKKERNHELDTIITRGRTALEFTSPEHLQRHSILIRLAGLLSERFNKEGREEDLDELITLKRAVSKHTSPDEPQRHTLLLELDNYLSERFKRGHSMLDLKEIISLRRAVLERIPQSNRCRALLKLADALHEQFQKQSTEKSIAEALNLARSASSLCPPGHPDHALPRDHLAGYLETTRLALNDLIDLRLKKLKLKERDRDPDAVITLGRVALEFTPPEHSLHHSTLIHLAGFLAERFNKDGRKEDLDELITLKRAVSEYMSLDEPQRQTVLLELDDHLSERFRRTDSMVDLEEIISLRRVALECIPPPNRCKALFNLANALHEHFQRQGLENSIAEAVSLAQAALDLYPPRHPDHALCRDRLASYLETKIGKKASRSGVRAPGSVAAARLMLS